jgi:hypothetical protein
MIFDLPQVRDGLHKAAYDYCREQGWSAAAFRSDPRIGAARNYSNMIFRRLRDGKDLPSRPTPMQTDQGLTAGDVAELNRRLHDAFRDLLGQLASELGQAAREHHPELAEKLLVA